MKFCTVSHFCKAKMAYLGLFWFSCFSGPPDRNKPSLPPRFGDFAFAKSKILHFSSAKFSRVHRSTAFYTGISMNFLKKGRDRLHRPKNFQNFLTKISKNFKFLVDWHALFVKIFTKRKNLRFFPRPRFLPFPDPF